MISNRTDNNKNQSFSIFSKGVFPASAAFLLESPARKLIKSPKKVADRLVIQDAQKILEIGAGSGFYSQEVANRLLLGQLVLIDIQMSMLSRAKVKLNKAGLINVQSILANAAFIPVNAELFDTVFMVTVLGEIGDKLKALNEAFRILRPAGLLSISEQRTDPDFLSIKEVKHLTEQAGFVFDKQFGNRWNYTANFYKRPSS